MKKKSALQSKIGYWYRSLCLWYWGSTIFQHRKWAIRVTFHQYRERLDTYLRRYWPGKTKGELRAYIRAGLIKVNSLRVKPDYRIRKSDVISIPQDVLPPLHIQPVAAPQQIPVLYEDRYVLVIHKPPGIIVHHNFHPHKYSVITSLFADHKLLLSPYFDMTSNVIHRLDKLTSGVMLVCRYYRYSKELQELFKRRKIYKEYRIVVHGRMKSIRGTITIPIRKDAKVYPSRMVADHTYHRHAVTDYEVLWSNREFSQCKVILHTGRTHQIRVHFAALGHPVVGDLKYSRHQDSPVPHPLEPSRMMLHSHRLQFKHPFTGQVVDVRSPVPDEFRASSVGG